MTSAQSGDSMWQQMQMTRRLPATLSDVETFCRELRATVFAAMPPRECFVVELVLREALTNAVLHGVNQDDRRSIECEVEMISGGIILRVRDDGEGFDWRTRLKE